MKILIVGAGSFRGHTGNSTDAVIAKALYKKEHTVTVATHYKKEDEEEFVTSGVKVIRIKKKFHFYPKLASEILFTKHPPDIVHIFHLRNEMAFFATFISKLRGVSIMLSEWGILHNPFLVKDRDFPLDTNPPHYENPIKNIVQLISRIFRSGNYKRQLKNYKLHFALYKSDLLLFLSKHNLPILSKLGIPEHKIKWFPTVIEKTVFQSSRTFKNKRIFNSPTVLLVAQFKLRKGYDIFLKSIPLVVKKNPDVKFILVSGSSSYADFSSYLNFLYDEDVIDNLIFLGKVDNEKLRSEILPNIDIYAMPSTYEGFGIPILECFQVGVPVIASDVVAINETIIHRKNGLLIKKEDPESLARGILELISNDELKSNLIKEGKGTLEKFYIHNHIDRLLEIYISLNAGRGHNTTESG